MTSPAVDRASTGSHFRVYAVVDGVSLGAFDTKTGGEPTGEPAKRASATSPSKRASLGGPTDISDVTVSREFRYARDLAVWRSIRNRVNIAPASVTVQPLDAARRPYGAPDIYTGTLIGATPIEVDTDSGDPAMWSLTIQVDGEIG